MRPLSLMGQELIAEVSCLCPQAEQRWADVLADVGDLDGVMVLRLAELADAKLRRCGGEKRDGWGSGEHEVFRKVRAPMTCGLMRAGPPTSARNCRRPLAQAACDAHAGRATSEVGAGN